MRRPAGRKVFTGATQLNLLLCLGILVARGLPRAAQAGDAIAPESLVSLVSLPAWLLPALLAVLAGALVAAAASFVRYRRLDETLQESEGRFRDFIEGAVDWFWECDADWRITKVEGLGPLGAADTNPFLGKTPLEAVGLEEPDENWRQHMAVIERRERFRDFQCSMIAPDGSQHWLSISGKPIFDRKGAFLGYRGSGHDVTAAREERELFAYVTENLSEGVSLWDKDDRFVVCNSAYRKLAGKASEILEPGMPFREVVSRLAYSGEANVPKGAEESWIAWRMGIHYRMDRPIEIRRGDHWYEVNEQTLPDKSIVVRLTDITERKIAEERLQQAQKIETVGKLTGGVAHDFNNLLAVVLGNLELVRESTPAKHPHRNLLDSAIAAADRGAVLTQRLLAFSRKQTLVPNTINANELVAGMDNLLRRTLGEQVQIEMVAGGGLWLCQADRPQLENALLNLAINARDAMPQGGLLTIETQNAYLDDAYAAREAEVRPGQYVLIAVTDTGQGIPSDIQQRIYEPFFTTKDVGQGSGLGLSMVYGFVKQSGGHISVYSELDQGTTFKIYLPRSRAGKTMDDERAEREPLAHGKQERILLVEDDSDLRDMAARLLYGLGYRVTPAADGIEAIAGFESDGGFDLLLTDAVLPGPLNGAALAKELTRRDPRLKVLFMSGYATNALVSIGRLDGDVALLQKPFRRQELAHKVRQVLDQPAPG